MKSSRAKALMTVNFSMVIMSFAGMFAKAIPWEAPILIFGRMSLAFPFLFAYLVFAKLPTRIDRDDWLHLLGTGLLLTVHWITFFYSVQLSTVAIGVLSVSVIPIFTAFLEPIIHREKLLLGDVLIAFIAMIGIVVMVENFSWNDSTLIGVCFGVVSAFIQSFRNVFTRNLVRKYTGYTIMCYQLLVGAVVLVPTLWMFTVSPTPQDWVSLSILAIVSTAAAHGMYVSGMSALSARTLAVVGNSFVFWTVLYAFMFIGEVPSMRSVIGGAIVVSAVMVEAFRKGNS